MFIRWAWSSTNCSPVAFLTASKDAPRRRSWSKSIVSAEVLRPSIHLAARCRQSRSVAQEKLVRQLRGDLDAIAMKALAKNLSDRYRSAAELAARFAALLEWRTRGCAAQSFHLPTLQADPTTLNRGGRSGWGTGRHDTRLRHTVGPAQRRLVSTPAVRVSANAAQPDKSVAVLPFIDLSENKDQEYFSDGLSEELINHLSHSAGLKVIARTSSFQFKGRNEDARSIAGKLGVAHLLEGSVRKGGQAIRVTTQLIQASDGAQLWSRTYDRNLSDIFTVQDEIAESVAKALNATLAIVDEPVGKQSDVDAYNLVLEGNYYKARRTIPDVQKAVQLYEQAIELRPNFALAWARLASAYFNLEDIRGTPSAEDNARIGAALDRAIALDPKTGLGLLYARRIRDVGQVGLGGRTRGPRTHTRPGSQNTYLLPSALGEMALVLRARR